MVLISGSLVFRSAGDGWIKFWNIWHQILPTDDLPSVLAKQVCS